MRKSIYYIAIVCLLFSQALTAAQANGRNNKGAWKGATRNIHHIAFWGGGGYSGLLNTYEHSKFTGGGGGLLGIGYE